MVLRLLLAAAALSAEQARNWAEWAEWMQRLKLCVVQKSAAPRLRRDVVVLCCPVPQSCQNLTVRRRLRPCTDSLTA